VSAVASARPRLVVEARALPSRTLRVGVVVGSVVAALIVGAVLLGAYGKDAGSVYRSMLDSSFGSPRALSQTLVRTAPILLTAAAAAVAFRLRIWTIGQDGQLVLGAIAASGFALIVGPDLPGLLLIPLALLAGIAGGALWALGPAVARAYLGTNEVLTTLMLNFIALQLMAYLVIGSSSPWRDKANLATAQGAPLPSQASLPTLFETADIGIAIALAVVVGLAALLRYGRWGYELRVAGDSGEAARYAGIDVARNAALVVCLSGALAGLAGGIQVTGVTLALDPEGVDPGLGLGYTGIVVAALARLGLVASIPVAVLMAALLNAGPALQLSGVSSSLVVVLQGVTLLLVAGSQFLLGYRVRWARA
jgi:general nucleoside transport system permease protein